MKKIEAIIRHTKLETVKDALVAYGVEGMTVTEVHGFGAQKGACSTYRGVDSHAEFVPRVKIEVIVADQVSEQAMDSIFQSAHTGEVGDGRILVTDLESVVRIRTGEVQSRAEEGELNEPRAPFGAPWSHTSGSRLATNAAPAHF